MMTQLFACASMDSLRGGIAPVVTSDNTQKILTIKHWSLIGRLSVRHSNDSWLTRLKWRHEELQDDLALSTSLGGVVAKLRYIDGQILMSDAGGNMRMTSNTQLQSSIGYTPPLQHLKFWVRGISNPRVRVNEVKESLTDKVHFQQDGWDVKLWRFVLFGDIVLPTRIALSKKDLIIKIVVDKWMK
jgi:outer membrane lipoprotein LolB